MKRTSYYITRGGCQVAIKHAWNSARRGIPDLVREIARKEGQLYSLVEEKYSKDAEGRCNFISGYQTWKGSRTGVLVTFEITHSKETEP